MTAALSRFAEKGYAAVSIEEIADAAGVTKGAVYHWFRDKDDLGRELQHDLYERLSTATMQTSVAGGDAVSNMIRAFDAYLALLGDLGEARFFLRDAWVIPALDEAGRHDHEDAVELIRGVLAGAIARGELVDVDPEALARVVTGVFAEATLHVLRTGDRAGTEAVVGHVLRSLRGAAAPVEGAAR
jgi:AcrR family transcriptional regulator